jgi:hypothetical protein
VRIETVAQYRGERPWAPAPALPQPRIVDRSAAPPGGAATAPDAELRPEAEGEDDPRFDQE